jgi:hypothetical protein
MSAQPASNPPSSPAAWNQARAAFAKSNLVDLTLNSLAQNLDVPPWPITTRDETAAAYIDLTYPEAVAALAAKGLPPTQLGALITLLNDTLAFDQPFGEMMDDLATPAAEVIDADSPLFKNLAKLELPETYPLNLTALSAGTIELCQSEKVETLGQFVSFAARLSQAVIVGGDFRELLNGLAHKDEDTLAKFLPSRPGSKGLFLREALAIAAKTLSPAQRQAILSGSGNTPPELRTRVSRIISQFPAQHAVLTDACAKGSPLTHWTAGLVDLSLEPVIIALLKPHLPAPAAPAPAPKKSFWGRLFGGA